MGTWGPGNLDNDYALEEIHTRSEALIEALMERARSKTSREADEYDYTTLFVELEMLFALEAKGLIAEDCLPAPEDVEALAKDYLADWTKNVDAVSPTPEHKRKRRQIIQRTFKRFADICRKHAE